MHRFFIHFTPETQIVLHEQAHQIAQVLRMRPGEHVAVLDNTGWEYVVVLQQVDKQEVRGEVVERQLAVGEPKTHITLYQSVFKWERFEWMLQKCTEVGVSRFVPVISQRSFVQKTAEFSPNRYVRCQRIIQEAAEQCGRGKLPVLETAVSFPHALSHLPPFDLCLMPYEQTQNHTICSVLETQNSKLQTIALFIGPEGGFTEQEVENGRSHGLLPVTLGKRILRAETAALVAATLLLHESGEM